MNHDDRTCEPECGPYKEDPGDACWLHSQRDGRMGPCMHAKAHKIQRSAPHGITRHLGSESRLTLSTTRKRFKCAICAVAAMVHGLVVATMPLRDTLHITTANRSALTEVAAFLEPVENSLFDHASSLFSRPVGTASPSLRGGCMRRHLTDCAIRRCAGVSDRWHVCLPAFAASRPGAHGVWHSQYIHTYGFGHNRNDQTGTSGWSAHASIHTSGRPKGAPRRACEIELSRTS